MIRTVLQILPVLILVIVKLIQYKLQSLGLAPIPFDLPELPTFTPDNRLANVPIEKLGEHDLVYPESFVLSSDEKFAFISIGDGRIVRINDPSKADISWDTIGRTGIEDDQCGKGGPADDNDMERKCGRPLGLWLASRSSVDKNFKSDDSDTAQDEDVLLVADAYKGFLMVTGITDDQPVIHTLASRAESDPSEYTFKLLNAAVQVPSTGDIYITETSQKFERRRIFYAGMDGRATGRLLRYKRSSGVIEVVAENVFMPNGITVSHDQQSLLIVCGVKILRFDLNSQRLDPKPFIEVMPGTGDNIKSMQELPNGEKVNCYYVALGGTYKKPFSLFKLVSDKVWLTSFILAVVPYQKIIELTPKWTALAVFDTEGKMIESFTDDGTSKIDKDGKKIPVEVPWISEFEPVGEYLYLLSWYNPFLARLKRSELEG